MTREEKIAILKDIIDGEIIHSQVRRDVGTWAIEELEQEPTKNNLGVDAVSRKDVHDMLENLPVIVEDKWFNWLQKACMRLAELPSVTPQPRKGHWILTDVEGNRIWFCNCSECGKDPQDYISGTENWWLTKNNLPKFCPNCGSRNEVEV